MSKKNKNKQRQQVSEEQIESMDPIQEQEEFESEESNDTATESVDTDVQEPTVPEEVPPQQENMEEEKQVEAIPEELPVKEEVPVPVKEEPKKEEVKPINKPKGVLIVEKKSAKAAAVIPQTVIKFNELADKYLSVMKKNGITEEDRQKAVMILSQIAQYVTMATDVRVFDACFKFMLKNRAIMLVPEVVMDGFYKYCDKSKITKITQFYVTFQSLVQSQILGDRFTINPTTIRRTFNNDALANWLILKKK